MLGAPGRTRTSTPLRATDFEFAASTNSATGARGGILVAGGSGQGEARRHAPRSRNDGKSLSLRHGNGLGSPADFVPHESAQNVAMAGDGLTPAAVQRCRSAARPLAVSGRVAGDGGALVAASGSRCGIARSPPRALLLPAARCADAVEFGAARAVLIRAADRPGARRWRSAPYEPRPAAAQWLSDLSPEQYREIRYRPGARAAAGRQPVLAAAVPSRLLPPLSGTGVRGRGRPGARDPLRPVRRSTSAQVQIAEPPGQGCGLRGLPRPLPVRGRRASRRSC